ncbi:MULTISPECIES: MarR family winged helix-turn-helix transcriptional regulator [Massilia]|uniref:MarR family transcriptional regulator n=1 Tax=Massilia rubra TaxID=2607910 RepID=A0ABX0LIK0_9BURK|nr:MULTISPECIES: MarR family transcriptional regulator [Massilia]NHZ32102.1 MarR family transcriptional regulator [Massilia rubra]NHZ96539.1 MarR family transcriptional regulator [Massilia sp. CCM 8734]
MSPIIHESNDNVNHSDESRRDAVLELIHTIMHQYRSQQFQALRDGQHELTHMEAKVLAFFGRHPGATQSELARHSGRDKAQVARLITALRERGLLHGEADPADRRNTHLSLTEAGKAIQQAAQAEASKLNAQAVRAMSGEQQQVLLGLLLQVKDNLDRND